MAGRKSGKLKVLVDSDVIFDFISARLPFYHDSERFFSMAEQGLINIVTLPHLVVNVWQIRGHMKIRNQAMYQSLSQLLTIVDVLDEPAKAISNALLVKNLDFEDWVTVECALIHGVDNIISRNSIHFKKSPVQVLTPPEFLQKSIDL